MKILQYFLLLILVLTAPLVIRAQCVPKAYETYDYRGTVNGSTFRFKFTDSYIGASDLRDRDVRLPEIKRQEVST